jgi:hypothetical protein
MQSGKQAEVFSMSDEKAESHLHKQKGWEHLCTVIIMAAEYLAVRYSQIWLAWTASLFLWFAIRSYARHYLPLKFRKWAIVASLPILIAATYYLTRASRAAEEAIAQTQTSQPAQPPSQQNTQTGNNNTGGNINQNGDHNTAIIGNNNSIQNTYNINKGESKGIGWLRPSHEPTPHTKCSNGVQGPKDLTVFLGNNVISVRGTRPSNIPLPLLRLGGRNVLTLNKDSQGLMAISAEIFNSNDDAIVVVDKNKFTASKEAFIVNSSPHSLRVTVEHLNESVLEMQYLNPHAVRIKGHFHFNGSDVIYTDDKTLVPGGDISGESCEDATTVTGSVFVIN